MRKQRGIKRYRFCITPNEYNRFHRHPATRMYLHSWNGQEITIETGDKRGLAADLMQVIDFGATSAIEVLESFEEAILNAKTK